MRPIFHGDVVAAARTLYEVEDSLRDRTLDSLLIDARNGDSYRKRTGQAHPEWGDGSLMSAALLRRPRAEPPLSDTRYCQCLAAVFERLVKLRANS